MTIVTSEGAQALAPIGWRVDPEPEFVIGDSDSANEQFHEVSGLRAFQDGTLLVVDGGSAELRLFGPDGELSIQSGGKGAGPGEFEAPVLVPWASTDSLLLFDRERQRFQIFSRQGEYARTIQPEGWPGARPPIGAVGSRVLVEVAFYAVATQTGPVDAPRSYRWINIAGGDQTEFKSFILRRRFTTVRPGRRRLTRMIPFSAEPAAATTEDAALITDGRSFEIREYGTNGRLQRILRVNASATPVTDELVAAQVAQEAERSPASRSTLAEVYDQMPLPDSLPVFQSLIVDESGLIWAQLVAADPSKRNSWMVFGLDGRAKGIVQTPPGLAIHVIGDDFLVGVWRDELDIEHVVRHGLLREMRAREE